MKGSAFPFGLDVMMRCINCGIAVLRTRRHIVSRLALPLQVRLARWLANQIPLDGYACHDCYNLLNTEAADNERLLGHTMVCRGCGVSVGLRNPRRRRFYTVAVDNPLVPLISNDNNYQDVATIYACQACWVRANRRMIHDSSRDVVPSVDHGSPTPPPPQSLPPTPPLPRAVPPTPPPLPLPPPLAQRGARTALAVNLPNYKRASNTSSHCIFSRCNNGTYHLIPAFVKRILVQEHNFYVPRSCRVCEIHLFSNEWHSLPQSAGLISTFNVRQIEDLVNIAKSKVEVFNFNNVEEMPDNVCHYWTGLTVTEFLDMYNSIPPINSKQPKRALALYLMKLRTGDTYRRLSTLFDLPRSTVHFLLKKVRTCLTDYFVPQHLGVGHLTHEQLAARNLRVPESLFGNPDIEPRSAIALFDGTYIFLQKSSNYLFQKKTYSLHKYDNLVKPFVICSCDGHIIDVLGPYAATQSDADIIKSLFEIGDGPFRNLFRPNDIFILDRGFRDAIPFLESLNYKIFKPESLDVGQQQLTYSQANQSRKVTLCRWVVEIINGRFKRDFKIFRQRYFNIGSRNLMLDLRIAGALLNKFHPLIQDGPNVQQIIERVHRYMDEPNHLGIFVNNNNLNRRRVMFTRIDANLPQLQVFPIFQYNELMLFSLGPYQVKQARSYYGEHIRENGIYHVEVCPELEHSHEMNALIGGNNPYLLRGRIKSRHVSQKIYFTYILLDREPSSNSPLDAILGYYCNCLVGNRTVGCCCHVMTLVWYLGWARHQDNVLAPATFLDNVLVSLDDV